MLKRVVSSGGWLLTLWVDGIYSDSFVLGEVMDDPLLHKIKQVAKDEERLGLRCLSQNVNTCIIT
jgi:hypothetical protein